MKSKAQTGLIAVLAVLLFSACAVQETKIYSLNVPAEKTTANSSADASIVIIVHTPRYLSQPYMAYRNSPYQLNISRYSKWDASPNEMLKEVFKDALSSMGLFKEVLLSNSIHGGAYSLRINLRRFERSNTASGPYGELLFDAGLITPDNREIYRAAISKQVKLDDRSFLSLAQGLSAALAEGVDEVKKSIRVSLAEAKK